MPNKLGIGSQEDGEDCDYVLVVSYNGEANISILTSRFELENNSIGQWTDLIHDRIGDAITTILPQPNNVFVVEYEEIMLAQDLINKI